MAVAGLSIEAASLRVRTKRGLVFRDVSFNAKPGDVIACCGPGGSGRTCLLLAISGRMRFSRGSLTIGDQALPKAGPWVRRNSSVCPAPGIDPLVENMRVSEELRRAELLAGKYRRTRTALELLAVGGFTADPHALVSELDESDRTRLRAVLGFIVDVPLVLLDDLGAQVPASGHEQLWVSARACAEVTGATLVASSLEPVPARQVADQVIEMWPAHAGSEQPLVAGEVLK